MNKNYDWLDTDTKQGKVIFCIAAIVFGFMGGLLLYLITSVI